MKSILLPPPKTKYLSRSEKGKKKHSNYEIHQKVKIIRTVRDLIQISLKSIFKNTSVSHMQPVDRNQMIKKIAYSFVSVSNLEKNFTENIYFNNSTKDWYLSKK